ncbi:MAG: restriction endonuclease subunit S [Nitrospira sp.]|nr:restriction endonuclease subunit S [Nitrospira sp.]
MKSRWQTKRLGELAELRGRIGWRGLTAKEYTKTGPLFLSVHSLNYGDYVDFRDAFHISEGRYTESPEIMLRRDDVLICKDGAGIGKLGIVGELPDRTTINSSLLMIRSGKSILPKFLYRCLTSPYFQNIVQSRLSGATTPHLYQRDITEFPIVLPPLPEQQRIVGILDEAFYGLARATANAEQNLQNARPLFESHLQSVFTQRGKGWEEKRLEEVLGVQPQNGWSPPAANHADSGTPVLTLSAVTGFVFRSEKIKFTSAVTDSRARYWVRNGDFLITRSNTAELVGHVAIASGIEKPTIYPDLIMRMNPDPAKAVTEFLYYQMRTSALRKEISGRAQGANPTMKKISNEAVRTLPIVVPPIREQHRVVAQLDSLAAETQRLESIYQQKLAALGELKKSLLHQAFSGAL